MYIIVGLGNPEERYARTFHNMGFNAAADAAELLGAKFRKRECASAVAEAYVNGEKVIIARPLTYMNLSGEAVKQLLAKYRAKPSQLVVIYDDYDIPKGKLRIRPSGSAGTHNGMRSIVSEIGTQDFARIRIGIRDPQADIPIMNYVLSEVRKEDYDLFISACNRAARAAVELAKGTPIEEVMTGFNG
ncbi:MAG TPA: aminoacyl-tRNA hydrolase [Candidatus Coproplasma avistercoris]|nr:aminoacyl-tRNA hydrolase [Candidatus Coproplasma avistercoris]